MMNITIVAFGKIKNENSRVLAEEYLKRLKPYARIKIEELKSESFSNSKSGQETAKKIEGERLQNCLKNYSESKIFLLAEKGKELDSQSFSQSFGSSTQSTVFVIGGALGFSSDIFNSYNKLSLSKLTFPHELARVLLLEQLYRASTISNLKTYHY